MDLNLDNYSLTELKTVLEVPENDINITLLQQCLYDKISTLKNINDDNLPEKKII